MGLHLSQEEKTTSNHVLTHCQNTKESIDLDIRHVIHRFLRPQGWLQVHEQCHVGQRDDHNCLKLVFTRIPAASIIVIVCTANTIATGETGSKSVTVWYARSRGLFFLDLHPVPVMSRPCQGTALAVQCWCLVVQLPQATQVELKFGLGNDYEKRTRSKK